MPVTSSVAGLSSSNAGPHQSLLPVARQDAVPQRKTDNPSLGVLSRLKFPNLGEVVKTTNRVFREINQGRKDLHVAFRSLDTEEKLALLMTTINSFFSISVQDGLAKSPPYAGKSTNQALVLALGIGSILIGGYILDSKLEAQSQLSLPMHSGDIKAAIDSKGGEVSSPPAEAQSPAKPSAQTTEPR